MSLVGDGLVIGGAIAAPFTLGFSLIATAVGGAVCAAGGITSAGAGIAEFRLSKKKMSEIQEAVDKDNKQAVVIERMWRDIMGACTEVARKHSDTGHSVEDVLSVLLVCCINKIPDKILSKAPIPKAFREKVREKASDPKLQKRAGRFDGSASHAMDVVGGVGTGTKSLATSGRAAASVVLTALVVQFADKGSVPLRKDGGRVKESSSCCKSVSSCDRDQPCHIRCSCYRWKCRGHCVLDIQFV